jgi:exosortase/archaeosortase family protein
MTSEHPKTMSARHRAVFFSAVVLMASWAWANLPRLADGQNGVLTFFLGSLFATALIFRSKPEGEGLKLPGWALGGMGAVGMGFSLVGLIIPVHQFEWLGILMVLYAALAWALPRRYGKDLIFALCLVYWIHPLPSQLFGPLQMGIQWVSVKMSEGLLQIFNVRVWGDGFVLRTGARVFGVPEACSGMKTAITVMFCGVGVGLLMRLKFWPMTSLLVLGMIQVVALNVLRIAGIVWIGMDKPADWNEKILHDTMGVFLLLAVALIHLDAMLIRQWLQARERIRNLEEVNDLVGEDDEKILRWPTIWRIIFQWWKPVMLIVVTTVLVLAAGYRLRPHHRMEMIRGVMQGLIATGDFENAQRAAQAALAMEPDDDELMVDLARIKMGQGKPEEGLRIIRRKPSQARSLTERVLEARALLELKRIQEVAGVVAAFPVESRNLPGVAMVLAEFNAYLDKPAEVGPYAVKAARGVGTQEAIRNLFPYMASRDLWDSIRLSDFDLPYATPLQGVIAAEAWLRINNTSAAANVLRRAMKGRETHPIFLNSVIRVTREWAIPEWVGRFEALFLANMKQLRPVELTLAMDGAFAIGRPDLGWIAYRCLETLAPDDPMLLIAPAEYGRKWFLFQHDVIGIAGSSQDLVDIKPFLQFAGRTSPWKELWADIPLADELGGIITREGYQRRLKLCLDALEKMESRKKLDLRLQLLWGRVLGELGRWDEAHAKLREFEAKAPRQHRDFLLAHSELYKAQSNWEANFEILSEFVRVESHPPLVVWLDLANAAMALDLGAYAMGCMEEARRDYPESEEWSLAMSGMWSFFGFWEEALFVVNQMKNPAHGVIRAKLLMETGRVMEGQKLVLVENLGDIPVPKRQTELLPPAEGVLDWRGGRIQEADYERERKAIKPHQASFLKALNRVKVAWYDSKGTGKTSDPSVWDAVGRDAREKAVALNELGLLLLRQGRTNEADRVISKALDAMPGWSLLWRLKLITSGSESNRAALAKAAVKACPLDSELWLGYVVAMGRSGAGAEWASRQAEKAVEEKTHSPGVLVRAGDYWLRQGFTNAACVAARAAMKTGQGLLPATVLGVMAAVKVKDYPWALACARAGTEQAMEPWPFYKIIIGLKGQAGQADPDVIRALEGLASHYPREGIWAAQLGEVYFRKGQTERALGVLEDALAREEGKKQALPRTYLLAAEAARREGNLSRAAKILKSCRAKYPDDVNVLNNLIFTLAQDPLYVGEAAALLPELIKAKRDDFAIYDTAALVFMRMGDLQQAEVYMKKALTMVKKGEYAWLEVYLNAAEAQIRLGKYKDARESLSLIMKSPERSAAMDVRARELQDEMTRREREQTGWF